MIRPTEQSTDTPRRSPNLEPEKVLTAAFRLLDEVGFAGLTLRRLASKLGVKAAALYWHFENKQDLIDQLAAKIVIDEFAKVRPAMEKADWRSLLTLTGIGMRDALRRYRDGATVIASSNVSSQTAAIESRVYILDRLHKEGFSAELALAAFFCVTRYTLGCVFEEQAELKRPPYPVSFEQGLEVILDGIRKKQAVI